MNLGICNTHVFVITILYTVIVGNYNFFVVTKKQKDSILCDINIPNE